MKKVIPVLVSVLMVCMVFSSCSSVDPIVGQWEYSGTESGVKVTMVYTFNENETFDMKIVGEYTSGDLNGTILPIMDTSTMEPKDTWNRDGDGEYIVHFTTGGDQKFRIEDGKLLTVNDDGSTVKNNDGSAAIFIKVNESK